MSVRTEGVSFGAGVFAPMKYTKFTVAYTTNGDNNVATYSYFVTKKDGTDILMGKFELETDPTGRDVRGELISIA